MHRNESGFVEVDRQAGRGREVLKNALERSHGHHIPFHENQRVIRILKDGTRERSIDGVLQLPPLSAASDKSLKDVRHDDEEVRGEGITLTEPTPTGDPTAGDPV